MELKKYQESSLETLRLYLKELNEFGPKHAFISTTGNPYKEAFFCEIPNIAVKIPTGGGKTLVGCYSVRDIYEIYLKNAQKLTNNLPKPKGDKNAAEILFNIIDRDL